MPPFSKEKTICYSAPSQFVPTNKFSFLPWPSDPKCICKGKPTAGTIFRNKARPLILSSSEEGLFAFICIQSVKIIKFIDFTVSNFLGICGRGRVQSHPRLLCQACEPNTSGDTGKCIQMGDKSTQVFRFYLYCTHFALITWIFVVFVVDLGLFCDVLSYRDHMII